MQESQVQTLVWEDPMCRGATNPVPHSYWACALDTGATTNECRRPRAHAPQQEKPLQRAAHASQLESSSH